MNSQQDFDAIYSMTFSKVYTLSFCLSASHAVATKVAGEVYNLFYEEAVNFKTPSLAEDYLLKMTNFQTFKYIENKKKMHKYINSAKFDDDRLDISQNNKNFYVNIVNDALTKKELKEIYVMHFFLSLSEDDIARILNISKKIVKINLNRARLLVISEYEKSIL